MFFRSAEIRALTMALGWVVASVLAGCNTSPNVMTGGETALGDVSAYVEITNSSLSRKIHLERAIMQRVDGFLKAAVIIRGNTGKTVEFEHMFQWFGADGMMIRDVKSHWALDRLYGYEEKQLQAIAPVERAVSFKMMIRKADPIER